MSSISAGRFGILFTGKLRTTSYITGKYSLERTLADYGRMKEEQGEEFKLKDFFDELNAIGGIPISLGRWQMTGLDDEIRMLLSEKPHPE